MKFKKLFENFKKPGSIINVTNDAYYPGPDMRWTEIMKPGILKKGETVWHWGGEMKNFLAKQTCFAYHVYKSGQYNLYSYTATKDIPIETDGRELRIDLIPGMKLVYHGFFWRGEAYEQDIEKKWNEKRY